MSGEILDSAERYNWNVVVLGAWNLSILTPRGVLRRIFREEEPTLIEISMDLEERKPPKLKRENFIVVPSEGSLEIMPENSNLEDLERACEFMRNALESLPETPIRAVGVNFRYKFREPSDELIEVSQSSIDDKLSDGGFVIKGHRLSRVLEWGEGIVNFEVGEDDGENVQCNFHLGSEDHGNVISWIHRVREMHEIAEQLVQVVAE